MTYDRQASETYECPCGKTVEYRLAITKDSYPSGPHTRCIPYAEEAYFLPCPQCGTLLSDKAQEKLREDWEPGEPEEPYGGDGKDD